MAGASQPGVAEVVLVPGLGALGYLMPLVRACATWTRLHLLDVPGFGDRRTARLPADLASSSGTVAAWLAAVPHRPVLLVGHSTGAQAALRSAVRRSAQLHGLVLAGATFAPDARRVRDVVRPVLRTLPHEQVREVTAVLPEYVRGARRLPQLIRSALDDRPEDYVGDVSCRVLVLRGRHDHLSPQSWAEQLAQRAGDGRLEVLPGGHNTPYTHPAATADALRGAAIERDG